MLKESRNSKKKKGGSEKVKKLSDLNFLRQKYRSTVVSTHGGAQPRPRLPRPKNGGNLRDLRSALIIISTQKFP